MLNLFQSKKARHGISLKGIKTEILADKIIIKKGDITKEVLLNKGFESQVVGEVLHIYNNENKAFAGTDFSNIDRCVKGLDQPYKETIQVRGSGFKVSIQPKQIVFSIGFSHQVTVDIPAGVTVVQDTTRKSNTKENILVLILTSTDINIVTKFAKELTKLRKHNPYKNSGLIREGHFVKFKKSSKGK